MLLLECGGGPSTQARIPPFMAKNLPRFSGVSGALLRKMMYSRLKKRTAG